MNSQSTGRPVLMRNTAFVYRGELKGTSISQPRTSFLVILCTEVGEAAGPRLREPRGQRESGGGIHATFGSLIRPNSGDQI